MDRFHIPTVGEIGVTSSTYYWKNPPPGAPLPCQDYKKSIFQSFIISRNILKLKNEKFVTQLEEKYLNLKFVQIRIGEQFWLVKQSFPFPWRKRGPSVQVLLLAQGLPIFGLPEIRTGYVRSGLTSLSLWCTCPTWKVPGSTSLRSPWCWCHRKTFPCKRLKWK